MKILINDVEIGAKYEETIYDFWIKCSLSDESIITVFDMVPFNLTSKVNHTVECLIIAGFISNVKTEENKDDYEISGTIIEVTELGNWQKIREDIKGSKWFGLETSEGVFLIDPTEKEELSLNQGDKTSLYVGRFDLVGVNIF